MNSTRKLAIVAAALLVLAAGLVATTGAEGARHHKHHARTEIFDLFGQKQVKPERIFLTANSGPYLKDLEWFNWGRGRATGVGTYVSDCASCPGPDQRPAIVRLKQRRGCEAKGGKAYKKATLTTGADGTGEEKTIPLDTGYSVYCK